MRSHTLWLTFGLVLALLPLGVGAEEKPDDLQTLKAMYEANQQWARQIDFCLEYRFRDGKCTSQDDALAGKFGSQADEPAEEVVIEGVIAHRPDQTRFSCVYPNGPTTIAIDETTAIHRHVSCEESVWKDVRVLYQPAQGDLPAFLFAQVKSADEPSIVPHAIENMDNGFTLGGGFVIDPFAEIGGDLEALAARMERVVHGTQGEIAILFQWQPQPGVTKARFLHFRTDTAVPMLEKVVDLVSDEVQGSGMIAETIASEFVPCGDTLIPTQVNFTSNTTLPYQARPAPWIAKEWIATNVRSPAADEDFSIPIEPGSKLIGVKEPERFADQTSIAPRNILKEDLLEAELPEHFLPQPEVATSDASGDYQLTPTLGIACMVGLAIAILALYQRERS